MSVNRPNILLIDPRLDDPDEQLALRYLRRALDAELAESEAEFIGAPPAEIAPILALRYGVDPARVERIAGQPLLRAVEDAFLRTMKPIFEGPEGRVFEMPWDSTAAAHWFRDRLNQAWPEDPTLMRFLAADVPTLWTACLAMDLAKLRRHRIADDPFPAPPILILGPTGVGKELLARAIHLRGGGTAANFGAINCGGLAPELLESELFGHKKGAFTGAVRDKRGFIEDHETVLLDEIGDMPENIQVRLLRFLNSGEFRPVGANTLHKATPRIISATNLDLEERVKAGKFREDLYQRLRGRVLRLRPLLQRPASLVHITNAFLDLESKGQGRAPPELTPEVAMALVRYSWPGNMRELRYVVEGMLDHARGGARVRLVDLPLEVQRQYTEKVEPVLQTALALFAGQTEKVEAGVQALMIRFELSRASSLRNSPQATFYRRFAAVIGRFAVTLQLEDQLQGQVDAFAMLADLQDLEDRASALTQLDEQVRQFEVDIAGPLGSELKATQEQIEHLRVRRKHVGTRAEREGTRYAAAALVISAGKLFSAAGLPLLEKAEQVAAAISRPPIDDGARAVGRWLRSLTVKDMKRFWNEAKAEMSSGNGHPKVSWREACASPEKLRKLYADAGWNQAELARQHKVRPETVQRKLKQLGIRRPRERSATPGKRTVPSNSARNSRR